VTNIGLDGANQQRTFWRARKDARQSIDLDGIAHLGSRTMTLDVGDVVWHYPGFGHGFSDNCFLSVGAREADTGCFPVSVKFHVSI
jgi:hypothetical protein